MAEANFGKMGVHSFGRKTELQFSGENLNFIPFEVRSQHLHTTGLCRSHLIAVGLRNAARSFALLFQKMPRNTIVPRHHMFCAHNQHENSKKPLIFWNLESALCTTARSSMLLVEKPAQFLQQLHHSTWPGSSNGAVCSSECR